MTPLVIDLSHYDNTPDFGTLKAHGIVGVIHKATEGETYGDPTYLQRKTAAKAAGLLWGSFHFGTNDDVVQQAMNYLNYANPGDDEIFCLDLEDNPTGLTMSEPNAVEWISYVETVLKRSGQCVLYSGNLIKEYNKGSSTFWGSGRLWLAQYASAPVTPPAWDGYWLWQYTDGSVGPEPHTVPGAAPSGVDCSVYQGTPGQLAAEWATGIGTVPQPAPEKTLGQTNYEGYCGSTGGKSLISGNVLPTWDKQSIPIQEAWEAGAQAVKKKVQS